MTTTAHRTSLADVRALKVDADRAEVDKIVGVLDWLEQHLVDPRTSGDVALAGYGDGELSLAGEGAPAVSEAAVVELLTTLGLSDSAGRHWLGKALELKYRLPRLWRRVLDLEVAPWRAFRVAESTQSLPLAGAAFVDARLAGVRPLAVVVPARADRRDRPGRVRPRRGRAAPSCRSAALRHPHRPGRDRRLRLRRRPPRRRRRPRPRRRRHRRRRTAGRPRLRGAPRRPPLDGGRRDRPRPARPRPRHHRRPWRDAVRAPVRVGRGDARQHRDPGAGHPGRRLVPGGLSDDQAGHRPQRSQISERLRPHRPDRRTRPARPGRSACSRSARDEPDAATSTIASRTPTGRRRHRTWRRCVAPTTA